MYEKNFNYFLMDGTPTGRIKCSNNNWSVVAYRVPRTELEKCKDRKDLSQSGVYFLFATSEESDENLVYVGQADVRKNETAILNRVLEHTAKEEEDWWTEAILFTTSNDFLGATEISWLENYFWALAKKANRYLVKNEKEPTSGKPTEETLSDLHDFVIYAKMIMGILGHKVFEPLIHDEPEPENLLYIEQKAKNFKATCARTSEGYIVKQGSMIKATYAKDTPKSVKEKRKELMSNKNISSDGILKINVKFNNPSYAAAFVLGHSVSGLASWKTAEGKTLKEIEQSEIK